MAPLAKCHSNTDGYNLSQPDRRRDSTPAPKPSVFGNCPKAGGDSSPFRSDEIRKSPRQAGVYQIAQIRRFDRTCFRGASAAKIHFFFEKD
jgi:hypothetical protein